MEILFDAKGTPVFTSMVGKEKTLTKRESTNVVYI